MSHTANAICNSILEGNTVTLELNSLEEATALHNQLRVIKSRLDKQFKLLAGVSISDGKALAMTTTPAVTADGSVVIAKYFLAAPKKRVAREYKILAIDEVGDTDASNV